MIPHYNLGFAWVPPPLPVGGTYRYEVEMKLFGQNGHLCGPTLFESTSFWYAASMCLRRLLSLRVVSYESCSTPSSCAEADTNKTTAPGKVGGSDPGRWEGQILADEPDSVQSRQ